MFVVVLDTLLLVDAVRDTLLEKVSVCVTVLDREPVRVKL